ncbi:cell division protein FtsQ/DivIB [Hydrogenophaga pseudoflava]|uniref:cell division protein FtsQ/DivIB n=1 Tax=Hydrogenophaga pseudoflava TaxID=47421 RepID=UPI0027E5B43B|nr:cell division protein FtsQ/DivIB [Hydrogenophaga pseudoflava]MDQ7745008.1 cell division protein FtsQ/DivIB [Hydrogenophaga pseudoflava]
MQHADLPLDIRLMTVVTRGLVVVFVLLCLGAVGTWIARHPAWALKGISVQGDLGHQNAVGLRAQLATPLRKLEGSFLTLDLQQVRRMFEAVPWVRHARVQREFPNRLRVTLEEHEAVAWWGQSGSGQLVSRLGEVFEASPDEGDGLPELAGPAEQAPQVWALYQRLAEEVARLDRALVRLELNERGSWRAELDNGTRLELGRGSSDDLLARTRRFTTTVGQLAQRYPGALQSVDLRYPNGYALRVQGVTTLTDDAPATPTRNR